MTLGAAIVVLAIAFTGSASAKGGLSMKAPQPFTKEELILIEKCRYLAVSQGVDSASFARQCSAERPYLYR